MIKYDTVVYTNNISWGIIGDEVFVFNEENDKIYLLKGIEKDIWLLLRNQSYVRTIIQQLSNSSNIDEIVVEANVFISINKLIKTKLLCGAIYEK